jgi:nicotinamidase-related amidase
MRALIVIDAQNEFSENGKRAVPTFNDAMVVIRKRVSVAREENCPIAWVRHFNKPHESKAFVPGTWGSDFVEGLGPLPISSLEKEFQKNVYGAFTGSDLGEWLTRLQVHDVLIVGFYTHGCVSTTAREAIMRELDVYLDPDATGACDMQHDVLGQQSASEVKRTALLHLVNMGAYVERM